MAAGIPYRCKIAAPSGRTNHYRRIGDDGNARRRQIGSRFTRDRLRPPPAPGHPMRIPPRGGRTGGVERQSRDRDLKTTQSAGAVDP
jgi:hypothetical protein